MSTNWTTLKDLRDRLARQQMNGGPFQQFAVQTARSLKDARPY